MFKVICFFLLLAVVSCIPAPPQPIPAVFAPHLRVARQAQQPNKDAPVEKSAIVESGDDQTKSAADDMEGAETFGFGFHKHIHVYPSYRSFYPSYYGGYGYGGYGGYYNDYGYGYAPYYY
ncbi:prismalin-14-like [Uranotaenia lowii]|uniref:prismalin-14-like n=1 Tax=Uranotaenia lowii TaxID=190385 RepID=UPI0024789B67|nr:prismalin-14-like [Uranotaenia lowii]